MRREYRQYKHDDNLDNRNLEREITDIIDDIKDLSRLVVKNARDEGTVEYEELEEVKRVIVHNLAGLVSAIDLIIENDEDITVTRDGEETTIVSEMFNEMLKKIFDKDVSESPKEKPTGARISGIGVVGGSEAFDLLDFLLK